MTLTGEYKHTRLSSFYSVMHSFLVWWTFAAFILHPPPHNPHLLGNMCKHLVVISCLCPRNLRWLHRYYYWKYTNCGWVVRDGFCVHEHNHMFTMVCLCYQCSVPLQSTERLYSTCTCHMLMHNTKYLDVCATGFINPPVWCHVCSLTCIASVAGTSLLSWTWYTHWTVWSCPS